MLFALSPFDNKYISNPNHRQHIRQHRHLRDSFYHSASNHSKQHYTYQYMSYYGNSDSNTNTTDHSIVTSVSIRVTPIENYYVSWGILWSAFVITSMVATWQVYREHRIFHLRRLAAKSTTTATTKTKTGRNAATTSLKGVNSSNVMGGDNDDEMNTSITTTTNNNNNKHDTTVTTLGDVESVSTADLTRSMFRKLLLLAMITRIALIPVQIWSDPIWWQFVSDTLPEMVFASAWTVLVTFFVQLVGIATGTGTNTSPELVISATVYMVYLILILVQIFNKIASVLLYALMCCIYATLFGVVIYFCPRLIGLMRPSLQRHRGLALRLIVATSVCILIFGIHCINYALLVIAPPRKVYWWYQYGILELIPAITFLFIMHPQMNPRDRSYSPTPEIPHHSLSQSGSGLITLNFRATEIDGLLSSSQSSGQLRRDTPLVLQHKGNTGYGAATIGSNEVSTKI